MNNIVSEVVKYLSKEKNERQFVFLINLVTPGKHYNEIENITKYLLKTRQIVNSALFINECRLVVEKCNHHQITLSDSEQLFIALRSLEIILEIKGFKSLG